MSSSGGGAASAAPSPSGKLVLVASALNIGDFSEEGLWVMNADGSGLRQITRGYFHEQPHWSPDGRLIAFSDESDRVVLVRGDGSHRQVLGKGANLTSPDPWSPDGRQIAWGGCVGLCIHNFSSGTQTRLPLGSPATQGFSWFPDGRTLVVSDRVRGLVVLDRTGKTLRVLGKGGQLPAVSPDGTEVAFVAGRKLELVAARGGRVRVLDPAGGGSAPSWSPDGRHLLYSDLRRGTGYGHVIVMDVRTEARRQVSETAAMAHWSPGGAMIAFGRNPGPFLAGEDVWLAPANGGTPRQLTHEFPTGLGFTDIDWAPGSVPAGTTTPPPPLVALKPASDHRVDELNDLTRAATPDSVAYSVEDWCDPIAETTSSRLNIWTVSSGSTTTTATPCEDLPLASYALTANLVAWCIEENPVDGTTTVEAGRSGTTREPAAATWESLQETPDIGWRSSIGPVVGDGTTIVFESANNDGSTQLWRIVEGTVPHAVQIPSPADATDLVDADSGRILMRTGKSGYVVLGMDGSVLARVPAVGEARLGGDLLAVASNDVVRVYADYDGSLLYQLPLDHSSGQPRLLAVGEGYVVYASGIAVHLLGLQRGSDRVADLPGQAGPVEALLTESGLFLSYYEAYAPVPGHLLFVPVADLP